ncbi:MAG: CPBP family intramembrane metalloprotease, partial [bacterium]|nr:CPBP family intramembrane metalloprotease [Candidatus Kapabacteria bacterium]
MNTKSETTITTGSSDTGGGIDRGENPVRFGVLTAIGVTLLFQFGAQLVLLRFGNPSMLPVVTALSQISLMLVPAIYAARAQELPIRDLFRLHKVTLGFHVAAVVGIVTLWPIVQSYLIIQELYLIPEGLYDGYRAMQQRLQEMYERLLPTGGMLAPILSVFAGALVPGVCEEMVFRGATQRSFERRMRPVNAIIVSSLLFAALHLQPHNFIPLLVLGGFLGLIAWSSGSVYPAIVGHFFFNALMIGALYTIRAAGERPSAHSESDLLALLPGV